MNGGELAALRRNYHREICEEVLRITPSGNPNNADSGSRPSVAISKGIIDQIGVPVQSGSLAGQTAGSLFESKTKNFLLASFGLLQHLRPGSWNFSLGGDISEFEQYHHLLDIRRAIEQSKDLRIAFGDYIVKPDIVIFRDPVSDAEVNRRTAILGENSISSLTPLRGANSQLKILHASVSCKWTIRSDRSQNARTEGLNLIRNRKGRTPHIVVVVAEPLPARIASLAFGTGDIDCVYHFALPELRASTEDSKLDSDLELLDALTEGKRLRDISDLPFDLAI